MATKGVLLPIPAQGQPDGLASPARLGRSMELPKAKRLVSHVVNSSGSAVHPAPEQGRAPLHPSLARCSSLSQSMLTEWLCWSDNGLRPGRLCSKSHWRLKPLGTVPLCHTQVQATSWWASPSPQPGPAPETRKPARAELGFPPWPPLLDMGWAGQPVFPCPRAQGSGMSTGFEASKTLVHPSTLA